MALTLPSVRCAMLALASLMLFSHSSLAWTPYKVDVTQEAMAESSESEDHLEPANDTGTEFVYLAEFIQEPSFSKGSYFVLFKQQKSGIYVLRTGPIPDKVASGEKPPKGYRDVEIPKPLAEVIYQIWVNALLQTHYDKKSSMGLDGTTFIFSSFVRGLGWLHGTTWSPVAQLPPRWLADTGDQLFVFANDPKRDPKKMQATLEATRDRLFGYLKRHGSY